ncbi:MAG: beta-N-acetylhexosaminidase [Clostridia bacterium]
MKYSIIPQPNIFEIVNDKPVFTLTKLTNIVCDEQFKAENLKFTKFLKDRFDLSLLGTGKENVFIKFCASVKNFEGYSLEILQDVVYIKASSCAGVFYALESLKQLLIEGELKLPQLKIEDEPAFAYRGFMLDTSRYFYDKEAVKHFIDIMVMHKLNVFHWHITDDQGWRMQLQNHILLTEIGGFRSHTNFNNKPHGGFYTTNDMKEIVAYAHENHIRVIPEIDTPGHVVSAIAAYPELSCFSRTLDVATHSGVKHDVLCVGRESTYDFMFSVLDEACEIFTDGMLHIGADEVPTTRWKICPHCQKRMKDSGLKNESELHTYYTNRIGEYLLNKGVTPIMWNDMEQKNPSNTGIVWQYWHEQLSHEDVVKHMKDGRDFINSASESYYFDLPYGNISLEKTYNYNPFFKGVGGVLEEKLLGVESALWSEYVPNMKKAYYCLLPRLGAYAENAWLTQDKKSYDNFMEKMDNYYMVMDFLGIDHASLKQANPNTIRKLGYLAYFERRKLHWQGLHNIIDNKKVEKLARNSK